MLIICNISLEMMNDNRGGPIGYCVYASRYLYLMKVT